MKTATETRARELKREYARQWREKHREHTREYARQWRAANPEKNKEYIKRYWERRADRDIDTLTSSIREEQGGNE